MILPDTPAATNAAAIAPPDPSKDFNPVKIALPSPPPAANVGANPVKKRPDNLLPSDFIPPPSLVASPPSKPLPPPPIVALPAACVSPLPSNLLKLPFTIPKRPFILLHANIPPSIATIPPPTPTGSFAKAFKPVVITVHNALAITLPTLVRIPTQSTAPIKSEIAFATASQSTLSRIVKMVSRKPFAPSLNVFPSSAHPDKPVLGSIAPISARNELIASEIF